MSYHRAKGRVTRIYPDSNGCYIRLDFEPPAGEPKPKDELFHLKKEHENYNSLFSFALMAAANGYELVIRTMGSITAEEYPGISYMVIDW